MISSLRKPGLYISRSLHNLNMNCELRHKPVDFFFKSMDWFIEELIKIQKQLLSKSVRKKFAEFA